MSSSVFLAVAVCLGLAPGAAAQGRGSQGTIDPRLKGLDTNGDGAISRQEWRGSDRAFRNRDWNNDNMLSGDEMRVGAARQNEQTNRDADTAIEREDDWTIERFRVLDRNNDNRLSRAEWRPGAELFARVDRNRNNFISAAEFTGEDDARDDRFAVLDTNRDGRIRRNEWRGSAAVFDALDANRDGELTRAEAVGTEGSAGDEFSTVDVNGDGSIARAEWHWNANAFDRLDADRDGRLSRQEWNTSGAPALPQQTPAYRAGYDRGRIEGIQAGRKDKPRGWDLEGQRELEQADSGYQARIGNRADYQAGYRAGFRSGYREGFGRR